MIICTNPNDPFLLDKDTTIWIATLSDNTQIFQDDNRPELNEPSAWRRLKTYLGQEGLHIVGVHFRFRSHVVSLPSSPQNEYYWSKGVGAACGGRSSNFFIYGRREGDVLI